MDHLQSRLRDLLNEAKAIYEQQCETKEPAPFYEVVKPFADRVDRAADEWEEAALSFLKKAPQKHLHPAQIGQAADNARRVGAHAYFFESSKAKFKQSADSALFVIDSLEKAIRETIERPGV